MLPLSPGGYKQDPNPITSHWRTTDPKVCADIMQIGHQGDQTSKTRTARAQTVYSTTEDTVEDYESYEFTIDSHREPVSPALLGKAGEALSECASYSLRGEDDNGTFDERVLTESVAVRNIGEQTIGVRLTAFTEVDGTSHRIYLDHLTVRVGHNLIDISHTTYDKDTDMEKVQEYAEGMLEEMKE